ncbi:ABC transporter ATP-binding protein [Sediminicurvatus halobius]|uniref:ABC transporter ATP-binding protein n=1 Tax=Sediminicurvatus halobius TaxID=2182432 RepID=A0A2U2N641_9GAMM|nr:ABC transporter ATP-binding protein [Spiribacter halobius]PWG64590.1 ABC transporter ATP-binding protein [Spiribacter halobius]UEX79088.1 ABC transporter ATP-binding protein [Spiribacter halobius]
MAVTGDQPDGMALLDVTGLAKNFGGLRALDGADLQVRAGTITGLIGPNGAGKTTLFNVITGYIPADAGRVIFDGHDITNLLPHRIFRYGLCRTFQIPREHQSLSVLENLMLVPAGQVGEGLFGSLFRGRAVRHQEARLRDHARQVLEFVELAHVEQEYARNLSGGQKKLLELARTLMTNPKLVLLDEPGAGVNPTLMQRLSANIRQLNEERGITFLVIEHDMDMIMTLCNPVVVMSEGRRLMEGPPAEVQRDPRVLEAYLGGQYAAAEG